MFLGALTVPFMLGCDELACGYGGPGCSPPALTGPCAGTLVLEAPTEATLSYFDDTGAHEANVVTVSSDPLALEVARVPGSTGRFVLTAHQAGPTMLTTTIEGWSTAQAFTLSGALAAGCPDAAGSDGGCACTAIRGFSLTR